jgi:hypothetical protein
MIAKARLRPVPVTREFVVAKSRYFVDVQLWPTSPELDTRGWLSNFEEAEIEHAVNLLNAFSFLNDHITDELFRSAVHGLSATTSKNSPSFMAAQGSWRDFMSSLIVTYVEGEAPNPTDSGYTFARKARQLLLLDEERQIFHPNDALSAALANRHRPVLFVDDFVGSGNQMIDTWERRYDLVGGATMSFSQLQQSRGGGFYYCPLVCTTYGASRIRSLCTGLHLHPAHELDEKDSLTHSDSTLWPDNLKATSQDFLYRASERAGIVASYSYGWKGFHDLGLAIAFKHSVPDATLPLYFWEQNGWHPLVRRT